MNAVSELPRSDVKLPDHKDLPCEDGAIVNNFLEHPQAMLLTDALYPVLLVLHPDGQFAIGQDCGIYWKHTNPPLKGAIAPDWFYVPYVPPKLGGEIRRSYVLWQEREFPLLAVEIVSGDGSEERDRTPDEGKFWIYEREVHVANYAIYDPVRATVEVHHLERNRFRMTQPNSEGRFPIPEMGIEIGLWTGAYLGQVFPWLRAWDQHGQLLQTAEERAQTLTGRLKIEKKRADDEKQRAERAGRAASYFGDQAARMICGVALPSPSRRAKRFGGRNTAMTKQRTLLMDPLARQSWQSPSVFGRMTNPRTVTGSAPVNLKSNFSSPMRKAATLFRAPESPSAKKAGPIVKLEKGSCVGTEERRSSLSSRTQTAVLGRFAAITPT